MTGNGSVPAHQTDEPDEADKTYETDKTHERDVRVFVVDDQELVREGITALLGIQPGIEVVGSACDGAERPRRRRPRAPPAARRLRRRR